MLPVYVQLCNVWSQVIDSFHSLMLLFCNFTVHSGEWLFVHLHLAVMGTNIKYSVSHAGVDDLYVHTYVRTHIDIHVDQCYFSSTLSRRSHAHSTTSSNIVFCSLHTYVHTYIVQEYIRMYVHMTKMYPVSEHAEMEIYVCK